MTVFVGAVLLSTMANGQETSADADNTAPIIESVVVTGTPIKDSQVAAIKKKRESNHVVDIISADSIGRFPDQNLADSLGRISGLAIERDQGQARFINFRGAPFRYTTIAIDGVSVIGAENGRIPRFDSFPSTITREVEVNKAITPDMSGEAVAGFININTFRPSSRGQGFHASGEVGLGNQQLGDVGIEKYNGRISYATDKFGILGFASYNKRGRITSNREMDIMIDPATDENIPNNLDFRSYRGTRTDDAYGGTIEILPSDSVRIYGTSIYSSFTDNEERNQFDFDIADDDTPGIGLDGTPLTPTTGYIPSVSVSRWLEDGTYKTSTFTNTLGVEFETGEWRMHLRGNYTETNRSDLIPIPLSVGGRVAVSYDVTNLRDPILNLFEQNTMNPITAGDISFPLTIVLAFERVLETEAYKVMFDAERDTTLFGGDTVIKTGFVVDLRDAQGGGLLDTSQIFPDIDIADFDTGVPWSDNFTNSVGGTNYDNVGLLEAGLAAGMVFPPPFAEDELITIDENIYSAFIMATSTFDWGNIVFGGRFELTEFTSAGTALVDGEPEAISIDQSYFRFLPSIHVNFDLTDELKLRVSGTSGLSRPNYQEARASYDVNATTGEIEGGNPLLKAESSYGADVSLEYYFAPGSLISIGGFVRFIDNVIYSDSSLIDNANELVPGVFDPGEQVVYNSFFNGDNGRLMGLEFAFTGDATFLPSPFDGFGTTLNVTLIDSSFRAPTKGAKFALPGTSDLVFNASVYYEKYGFSARLNYQYRDDWLSTVENDSLTEFWQATERVDATVRYAIPMPNSDTAITVFFDANNLTNAKDIRYIESRRFPNQVENFGRRFIAGVRFDL